MHETDDYTLMQTGTHGTNPFRTGREQQVNKFRKHYGYWGQHPKYPVCDWVYEVRNNDTRESYWGWVVTKVEQG